MSAKHTTKKDSKVPFAILLCILISLCDRFSEVGSSTIQSSSVGACKVNLKVRFGDCPRRRWTSPMQQVPLVAILLESRPSSSWERLPGSYSLDVGVEWQCSWVCLSRLVASVQKELPANNKFSPKLAVLHSKDLCHDKALGNIRTGRIVPPAVSGPDWPVRLVKDVLEERHPIWACLQNLLELSFAKGWRAPIVRVWHLPFRWSPRCMSAQFVSAGA
mmetsp:Transcript_37556/g.86741  ORF Transcript_37556/g.86741 Transcript_37556/m.86741 type:complete len:218 (-) Transcript_37556:1150-1803(-)